MRKSLAVVSGLLLLLGIVGSLLRVRALEAVELDHLSPFRTVAELAALAPRHALGTVTLREGQAVIFEVCASEGFAPEAWTDRAAFEVWSLAGPHLLRRTEVDAAQVARARPLGAAECMEIASADRLPTDGPHAVVVAWGEGPPPEAIAAVPLAAKVQAVGWPARVDHLVHLATLAGALLLVVTLLAPLPIGAATGRVGGPTRASAAAPPRALATARRVALGLGALLGTELLLAQLPFTGRTYAFTRGLVLAAVQLTAAFALVRPPPGAARGEALALVRPARPLVWLPVAVVAGLLLPALAMALQALVPATSETHVASLVVFPSGMLAVRVVGAFAPVVEEIFFRGFVYGEIERAAGVVAAYAVAVVAFAAVHLPQVAGDLGSFAAIVATGVVLTGLRRGSGSAVVPALAHLLYNASL